MPHESIPHPPLSLRDSPLARCGVAGSGLAPAAGQLFQPSGGLPLPVTQPSDQATSNPTPSEVAESPANTSLMSLGQVSSPDSRPSGLYIPCLQVSQSPYSLYGGIMPPSSVARMGTQALPLLRVPIQGPCGSRQGLLPQTPHLSASYLGDFLLPVSGLCRVLSISCGERYFSVSLPLEVLFLFVRAPLGGTAPPLCLPSLSPGLFQCSRVRRGSPRPTPPPPPRVSSTALKSCPWPTALSIDQRGTAEFLLSHCGFFTSL